MDGFQIGTSDLAITGGREYSQSEEDWAEAEQAFAFENEAPRIMIGVHYHWIKIAVVGLGGLGHMALKIAHAMGAEVPVLSQSLAKRDDSLRLGADHFHATSDPETFARLRGSFELILNTVIEKLRRCRLASACSWRDKSGLADALSGQRGCGQCPHLNLLYCDRSQPSLRLLGLQLFIAGERP